ncbi:MAG: hypothetical protein ABR860_02645 [Terracidiphilus sp.]|jgi:hypothetical protein
MEKHPISTGFLGFPWKFAHFLWFLPGLCLEDAILAAFFLDVREELQARNHAIPARTTRFAEAERLADLVRDDGRGTARACG